MDKTDHMEDIKIRFQHDYNEAIDNYNSGDCVLFFRNIRPAIETFCQLVIFDLVDTVLAEELLSGQKTLHCDYKNCTASFITPTNRAVEKFNARFTCSAGNILHKRCNFGFVLDTKDC